MEPCCGAALRTQDGWVSRQLCTSLPEAVRAKPSSDGLQIVGPHVHMSGPKII